MALLTKIARGRAWWVGRCRWLAWLVVLALLGAPAPRVFAQNEPTAEYRLKSVFLFRLTQFVTWPAKAFPKPDTPLVIGILGLDPFGAFLDKEVVGGEKLDGHPLIVRRYKRVEDVTDCHILFITRGEAGDLEKILPLLKGRSILTVGDVDTFTHDGGMVRFVSEGGAIKLRYNVEAAAACDLTISSKIVRPELIEQTKTD